MKTYLYKGLEYKDHTNLVSAASNYHTQFKVKQKKPSYKVYYYKLELITNLENKGDSNNDYDIDTSANVLLANMTKRNHSKNADYFLPNKK